jgi:hypothetical protein
LNFQLWRCLFCSSFRKPAYGTTTSTWRDSMTE